MPVADEEQVPVNVIQIGVKNRGNAQAPQLTDAGPPMSYGANSPRRLAWATASPRERASSLRSIADT